MTWRSLLQASLSKQGKSHQQATASSFSSGTQHMCGVAATLVLREGSSTTSELRSTLTAPWMCPKQMNDWACGTRNMSRLSTSKWSLPFLSRVRYIPPLLLMGLRCIGRGDAMPCLTAKYGLCTSPFSISLACLLCCLDFDTVFTVGFSLLADRFKHEDCSLGYMCLQARYTDYKRLPPQTHPIKLQWP